MCAWSQSDYTNVYYNLLPCVVLVCKLGLGKGEGMSIKQAIDGHVKVGVPLLYAFFISCGIFAAIASGVIEFQIFKQFFESNNSIDDAYIIIVLLSMVIIFEVTKIYLVFYREQLEALNVDKKKKWIAGYFRYLLIFLSILSTLIFSIG